MRRPVKPDDHSRVVPLLPIPNRKVKRPCADDSADSRVKVGHCQAINMRKAQSKDWAFFFSRFTSGVPEVNTSVTLDRSGEAVPKVSEIRKDPAAPRMAPTLTAREIGSLLFAIWISNNQPAPRNSRRKILPTFDLGSSSRNSMYFGLL
jgi:hypothetical protein